MWENFNAGRDEQKWFLHFYNIKMAEAIKLIKDDEAHTNFNILYEEIKILISYFIQK